MNSDFMYRTHLYHAMLEGKLSQKDYNNMIYQSSYNKTLPSYDYKLVDPFEFHIQNTEA